MENKEQKPKFYAGGFLYNPKTKSVLLHLRDAKAPVSPNRWGVFGGACEDAETPKQCFIREMREELNIDIKENELIPLGDYFNEERDAWRYVFYVESESDKSQMILGEGADFDWVSLDKVFDYDLTEKTRRDLGTF